KVFSDSGLLNDLSISTLFHPAQNRNFSPAGRSQTPIKANRLIAPRSSLKRESYRHAFFLEGGCGCSSTQETGLNSICAAQAQKKKVAAIGSAPRCRDRALRRMGGCRQATPPFLIKHFII